MRRIEQSDIGLVAHMRSRHLVLQFDIEPFIGGEAFVDRDMRAVVSANGTSCVAIHLNISDAVITDWAIPAIFFSFIAVLRSSA